jgi:hypothetical protein
VNSNSIFVDFYHVSEMVLMVFLGLFAVFNGFFCVDGIGGK